ncbi:MAG: hypothetical protein HY711_10780 [Candidatus Melainabacteria bacterium]|nr:hypothetical protein [Candidatus Melainabacteria bacterium]
MKILQVRCARTQGCLVSAGVILALAMVALPVHAMPGAQQERLYLIGQSGYFPSQPAVNPYAYPQTYPYPSSSYPGQPYLRGQVAEAPAGLVIPVTLLTAISTQVAKPGDYIEARVSQDIAFGGGIIVGGSMVVGQVTDAEAGRVFNRSGQLSIAFTELRTPGGGITPISGHLIGDIGKYSIAADDAGAGTVRGEGMGTKLGALALRSALGAGAGAALGTAMGAITHGRLGTGAWAGTAIGGGGALVEGLILRKGRNVIVPGGTVMQLQLDQPASISQGGGYAL